MQRVTQMIFDAVSGTTPLKVTTAVLIGGEPVSVPVVNVSCASAVGGEGGWSIGNALPSAVQIALSGRIPVMRGAPVAVSWYVDEYPDSVYPLFSGVCDTSETVAGVTTVTAYDPLYSVGGRPYAPSPALLGPCTAADVLDDLAEHLGVTVDSATSQRAASVRLDTGVSNLGDVTIAQAVGAVAGIMGGNAYISRSGALSVKTWQDTGWTGVTMAGTGTPSQESFRPTGLSLLRRVTETIIGEDGTETTVERLEDNRAGTPNVSFANDLATPVLAADAWAQVSGIPAFHAGGYLLAGGILLEPGDVFNAVTEDGEWTVYASQVTLSIDGGCTAQVECRGASEAVEVLSPSTKAAQGVAADLASFKREYVENLTAQRAYVHDLTADKATVHELRVISEDVASLHVGVNGLTTRVSATESVANSAKNKIDGLSVGGRNLLLNSSFRGNSENWSNWGSPTIREIVDGKNGHKWAHIKTSGVKFQGYYQNWITNPANKIEPSTMYVFSMSAYSLADTKMSVGIIFCDSNLEDRAQSWNTFNLSTESELIVWKFKVPDNNEINRYYFMIGDITTTIKDIYFCDVKLEKGTIATDWTPAPEDIETRMSTAESEIAQTAEEIRATVKKGDVISSINQTAEAIKIQADKINLLGKVTAEDLVVDTAMVDAIFANDINAKKISISATTTSEHSLNYFYSLKTGMSDTGPFIGLYSEITNSGGEVSSLTVSPAVVRIGSRSVEFSSPESVAPKSTFHWDAGGVEVTDGWLKVGGSIYEGGTRLVDKYFPMSGGYTHADGNAVLGVKSDTSGATLFAEATSAGTLDVSGYIPALGMDVSIAHVGKGGTPEFYGTATNNLPLTGGNVSGPITFTGDRNFVVGIENKGANTHLKIQDDSGGKFLAFVNSKGTIVSSISFDDGIYHGTATGNLPMSGGTITGDLAVNGSISEGGKKLEDKYLKLTGGTLSGDLAIVRDAPYTGIWMAAGQARSSFYVSSGGEVFWRLTVPGGSPTDIHHPKKGGTIALTSDLARYLPLSGGTITGDLAVNGAKTAETGAANARINSNGTLRTASSSSIRYKTAIEDLRLEDINGLYALPVRTYVYKDNYISEDDERYGKRIPGFIAEEVDAVLPIAVDHVGGKAEMWNSNILVPCLLRLTQDLNERVSDLKSDLSSLKEELFQLKQMMLNKE